MRASISLCAAICFAVASSSIQAGPSEDNPGGEWSVANGGARVRIIRCNDRYWGFVSWQRASGGLDLRNKKPALRTRPTLGMPILIGLSQVAPYKPEWSGQIYNANDGHTYGATINLVSEQRARVRACFFGPVCGVQDWQRTAAEPTTSVSEQPAEELCSSVTRTRVRSAGS